MKVKIGKTIGRNQYNVSLSAGNWTIVRNGLFAMVIMKNTGMPE